MKKLLSCLILCSAILVTRPITDRRDVDIKKKTNDVKNLVRQAVDYFKKEGVTLGVACRSFEKDLKWRKGEISVFMFDRDGVAFVNQKKNIIWQSFRDKKNKLGTSFIDEMFKVGEKGGWVSYQWNWGLQQAYVKTVVKAGKSYVIGAGFYPESGEFTTKQLVKSAVKNIKDSGDIKKVAVFINNPVGYYVKGPIYLWIFDTQGNYIAHGADLSMVGQNFINWQDADGKYRNREIIKKAQTGDGKGWVEYSDRGEKKRAYFERVVDPLTNKEYIVGGGYYPDINDDEAKSFVARAINYLKANGADVSFNDFSNKVGGFVKGPLTVFVYDLNGKSLADGENPNFKGQNLINSKDAEGRFIVRRILDQANNFGSGWVSFLDKNAYKDVYVEKIQVPDGDFVIGAGFWPSSKPRSVKSIVEKADRYLQTHTPEESFRAFTTDNSDFIWGDLSIFAYAINSPTDIACVADGLEYDKIWSPGVNLKDEKGQRISDKITATATAGGGWVEYPQNNATFRVYVKAVTKEDIATVAEPVALEQPTLEPEEEPDEELDELQERVVIKQPEPQEPSNFNNFIVGAGYYL